MMKPPVTIPTDNLWKFLFTSGVLLIVTLFVSDRIIENSYNELHAKVLSKIEYEKTKYRSEIGKRSDLVNKKNSGKISEEELSELTKLNEFFEKKADPEFFEAIESMKITAFSRADQIWEDVYFFAVANILLLIPKCVLFTE